MSFTQPVGKYIPLLRQYKPTANSVSTTGTATVVNTASAYDVGPINTSADFSMGSSSSYQVDYTTLPATTTLNANAYIELSGSASAAGLGSIVMSIDGGTTYPYVFAFTYTKIGPNFVYDRQKKNIALPNSIAMSNIKFRFSNTSTGAPYSMNMSVYDIYIEQ